MSVTESRDGWLLSQTEQGAYTLLSVDVSVSVYYHPCNVNLIHIDYGMDREIDSDSLEEAEGE